MINRKANEPTLKLQSYKIDNSVLTSKIYELNELKSQLQSTLSKHRHQENSIINELHQLKCQNQNYLRLRGLVSNLEFKSKSQNNLIEELQFKLNEAQKKAQQFHEMYENGSKNIKQLTIFYKKQMNTLLEGKQTLKNLYQNKIAILLKDLQHLQNTKNHFAFSPSENHSPSQVEGQLQQDSIKKEKNRKKVNEFEGEKRTTILPQKYLTSNVILEREEDSNLSGQDIYCQMIQHIYKQLLKIESKAQDLLKIPQIQAFNQLRNPSKKDLAKLVSSYPFHIKQNNKIELVFDFISKELARRNLFFSGKFIVKGIIQAIEKISNDNEIKLQSFEIYPQNSEFTDKNGYCQSQTLHHGKMELDKISRINDTGQKKGNIDSYTLSVNQSNLYI